MFDDELMGPEGLGEATDRYLAALGSLNPDVVTGDDAVVLMGLVDRVIRVASAKRLGLLRRVEATGAFRLSGDRSAAEFVARRAGGSLGEAQRDLALAERLDQAPATRERLEAGDVSVAQAEQVSRAAAADPSCELRLLESADRRSLSELREESQRVVAAATDADERRRRVRRNRGFRHWTDGEGAFRFAGSGSPEAGAALLAAIEPYERAAFEAGRRAGVFEEADRYRFDGLVGLARASLAGAAAKVAAGDGCEVSLPGVVSDDADGTGRGAAAPGTAGGPDESRSKGRGRARVEMMILVDLAALQRGELADGELCEIPGVGPVSVSTAREVLGESLLTVVVRDGQDIRTVARSSRRPTANQKRALMVRDQVCAIEGCGQRKGLEIDHNQPWAHGGATVLANLCRLCRHHHRLKTLGWALSGETGRMTLTPPPGWEQRPTRRRSRRRGPDPRANSRPVSRVLDERAPG